MTVRLDVSPLAGMLCAAGSVRGNAKERTVTWQAGWIALKSPAESEGAMSHIHPTLKKGPIGTDLRVQSPDLFIVYSK